MADELKLPGLNYNTPITIDDLEHLERTYTEEFAGRTLAIIGAYRAAGASFGIFAADDPSLAGDVDAPLFVEENDGDPLTVDVYPGMALTESGMLIHLLAKVTAVAMVHTEVGQQNVVFLEYAVMPDPDTVVRTRFTGSESRQLIRTPDYNADPGEPSTLRVASMTDWQNSLLFPPDRKRNIVPVAFITISTSTNSLGREVAVDLSNTTLTVNRPWFSPVDIEHRSNVGTGSSSVPHNLGLNDLAQGSLTLYQQFLPHGVVLGRDHDAPGVPGDVAYEIVTPSRVETDTDGSVTGAVSQRYVQLTRYPTRLLGAYGIDDPTNEMLVDLLPHTNLLTIHSAEGLPVNGFRVQYSVVDAGEPLPSSLINNEVHFRQPISTREMVIAAGKGVTQLSPKFTDSFSNIRAKVEIGGAPAIPKNFQFVANEDGEIVQIPQNLLCSTKLDDIGEAVFNIETTMLGAAKIRLGLFNATLTASTVVSVRLTGIDTTGQSVTEDLRFDISNYELPVVPSNEENSKNWQISETVFATLTSIIILDRIADGPQAAICVMADLDPLIADAIRDACPLAEAFWNGEAIARVRDVRPVVVSLAPPTNTNPVKLVGQAVMAAFAAQNAVDIREVLSEDMRDPRRLKLSDPLRFDKFRDGLESTILPEQPEDEAAAQGLDQDIYVSQALRLAPGVLQLHIALLGNDANRNRMMDNDGIAPHLEYRYAQTTDSDNWSPWNALTPRAAANGTNYLLRLSVPDVFKLQLRVKGSVIGLIATQFTSIEGSQVVSGVRQLAGYSSAGGPLQVAIPFGMSMPDANYRFTVNVYYAESESAASVGLYVNKIVKYQDHAEAWIDATAPIIGKDVELHWSLDLSRYLSTSNEGFTGA